MTDRGKLPVHIGLALVLCFSAVACGRGAGPTETVPAATPTREQVANATFTGILPGTVTLENGSYTGPPAEPGAATRPTVQLIAELEPTGDLDGDGVPEAVALLTANTGGSGVFYHIAPLTVRQGSVRQLGVALLGDRVQIRSMRVQDGTIVVETVETGPGDAMCCPTLKKRRVFALRDGSLAEISNEVQGRLSLEDLAGTRWVLTSFAQSEPAPHEPVLSLQVDAEHGTVIGSTGCNRYTGPVVSPSPSELRIGPLATTRKMCPPDLMKLEGRFLAALARATGYRFQAGRLAIDYTDGDPPGTLLFIASGTTTMGRKD